MQLTDQQLDTVLTSIGEASSPADALVAALRQTFIALGAGDIAHDLTAKIDGREWPLDSDQWKAIAEALLERGQVLDPVGNVNLALDWMNLGPSATERTAA